MIRQYSWGTLPAEEILARTKTGTDVSREVASIIANVRKGGDEVLREYEQRFDGVMLSGFEVTEGEKERALAQTDPDYLAVLKEAAANIRAFHEKQVRQGFLMTKENGVMLGQRILPLASAGVYVPGGKAAYPSTVLMDVIPAVIAGVSEIVMVTPPGKNGFVDPVILAAAHIAGVHRVFKCGGAQAIAALAYGTETIPRVDKIVGPGNIYVAEAKRQVFGQTGIDMIAGPSEVLIIGDKSADAHFVAADMLAQAEHDTDACAIFVTTHKPHVKAVAEELERILKTLPRESVARASIEENGKIILVKDLQEALSVANRIAPEHLELMVEKPFDLLPFVTHAGSVFLGAYDPEPMGDYFAGVNHTLPTSGTARFYSPLSVDDFVKKMQYSYYTKEALAEDYEKVALFAEREGLQAHAYAVRARFEREEGSNA